MNGVRFILTLAATTTVLACSPTNKEAQAPDQTVEAVNALIAGGDLRLPSGESIGTVKLTGTGDGAILTLTASDIPTGPHGFHLHQTGQCEGPDFKSAGGHLNPLGKSHGSESPDGSHVGDLLNLDVTDPSNIAETFALDGDTAQIAEWVLDQDGTAVVVHAGPDDYKTDPSGAAGARIACAVLTS